MVEQGVAPSTVLDGNNFRVFETRGYRVLFRSDGVVLTLSEPLFRYLELQERPESERRSRVQEEFGIDGLEHLDRGLQGLQASGILDFIPPSEPTHQGAEPGGVLLMITQTCNLACSYCYGDGGTYGGRTKLLAVETAQAAIDGMLRRAPSRRSFNVAFFGGEPLINFKTIKEVVAYCRAEQARTDKRFSYSITTNATLVTDEVVAFFKEHRFSVMVSFDGFDAPDNQRPFRDGRNSSEIVGQKIRALVEAGVDLQVRATLARGQGTREHLDQLVQIGPRLGVRRIAVSCASETKNPMLRSGADTTLAREELEQLSRAYEGISRDNLDGSVSDPSHSVVFDPHYHLVKALAEGTAVGMGRCGAGLGMSAVGTDGQIYPCHRFVGMQPYQIGSVETGVQAEKVDDFFARARDASASKCGQCWVRLLCTGGCFYFNADGHGGFQPPEEHVCDGFRKSVEFAVGQMLAMANLPPDLQEQSFRAFRNL